MIMKHTTTDMRTTKQARRNERNPSIERRATAKPAAAARKNMATTDEMKTYRGSCHCGRLQFEIRSQLTRVSECNCSICTRKGYLHHMVSPDRFRLVQGEEDVRSITSVATAVSPPSTVLVRTLLTT